LLVKSLNHNLDLGILTTIEFNRGDRPWQDGLQVIILLITASLVPRASPGLRYLCAHRFISKNTLPFIRLVTIFKTLATICGNCADPIVSII